jgi:uncharacterized membrane protein
MSRDPDTSRVPPTPSQRAPTWQIVLMFVAMGGILAAPFLLMRALTGVGVTIFQWVLAIYGALIVLGICAWGIAGMAVRLRRIYAAVRKTH